MKTSVLKRVLLAVLVLVVMLNLPLLRFLIVLILMMVFTPIMMVMTFIFVSKPKIRVNWVTQRVMSNLKSSLKSPPSGVPRSLVIFILVLRVTRRKLFLIRRGRTWRAIRLVLVVVILRVISRVRPLFLSCRQRVVIFPWRLLLMLRPILQKKFGVLIPLRAVSGYRRRVPRKSPRTRAVKLVIILKLLKLMLFSRVVKKLSWVPFRLMVLRRTWMRRPLMVIGLIFIVSQLNFSIVLGIVIRGRSRFSN